VVFSKDDFLHLNSATEQLQTLRVIALGIVFFAALEQISRLLHSLKGGGRFFAVWIHVCSGMKGKKCDLWQPVDRTFYSSRCGT
jgi:hypothetical protein